MDPTVPSATYRLQLDARFDLDAARRLLPYLRRLGIDTLYLSPVLESRRGSGHGYDGVRPDRIDPGRGGENGFRRLVRDARRNHLALLLDIVPNHLAASLENPAWADVLARGPSSRFARLFDIDWNRAPGRPKLALPWLEEELPESFRSGKVAFVRQGRRLVLRCGGVCLPVPGDVLRYLRLTEGSRRRGGARERRAISRALERVNAGSSAGDRALRDALLDRLWYRLIPWRSYSEVNYRRFADVADLVAVRSDTPFGFRAVHGRLLAAVAAGGIRGVRVDHVDGIARPAVYLRRLRRALDRARPKGAGARPYVVVEKILSPEERLRADWPVDGTTGYEALHRITGVLLPAASGPALDSAYRRVCPLSPNDFGAIAFAAKREVIDRLFPGERAALARRLSVVRADPPASEERWRDAIGGLTAALSVYRTYLRPEGVAQEDLAYLRAARRELSLRDPSLAATAESRALLRGLGSGELVRRAPEAVERWQQWSTAVAAKGTEDTAFYRFPRFLGANEVGGDPAKVGSSLQEFHAFMAERARRWPHGLTATSTHDSKWGEDARARAIALGEHAADWSRAADRWARRLLTASGTVARAGGSGSAETYRLFQVWAMTAPADRPFGASYLRRLEDHVRKATREAKQESSWTLPDLTTEDRRIATVRYLARAPGADRFRREFSRWLRRLDRFGRYYALAQVALRTTVPGIPDLYQGSEGWNLSMVDPDNRREVRFRRFERGLQQLDREGLHARIPERRLRPGRTGPGELLKLAVTARLLRYRAANPLLFAQGRYLPLNELGRPNVPDPVLAFARRTERAWLLTVVGRGLAAVAGTTWRGPIGSRWRGRALRLPRTAPGEWTDVLTGRTTAATRRGPDRVLLLERLFADLPLAVLSGGDADPLPPARSGGTGPVERSRIRRAGPVNRSGGPTRRAVPAPAARGRRAGGTRARRGGPG